MNTNSGFKSYILMGLGLVVVSILIIFMMKYNGIVGKEEQVKESWSQVESNLQRKLDLLPNLVKIVKSYAKHEKELLSEVTALRSNAHTMLSQKNVLSQKDNIEKLGVLKKSLDTSLLKVFAVAENYPDLKSSEQFLQLQSQIEGAENRINITRMQFNTSVSAFNAYARRIPANIVAGIGGFQRKAYFKAENEAKNTLDLGL